MAVVGLITEYNPFHNGHLHHLIESKKKAKADYSIAIMSGHFLQRGEPAIMDKWTRAKTAVEAGVDLVIELPTLFSSASAEFFAKGSVAILDQLNIVDTLCFGSEDGKLDSIDQVAQLLTDPSELFTQNLQDHLKAGLSFPKAREKAINSANIDLEFKPNNILGIEYLKALKQLRSKIEPMTIQRVKADYNSLDLKDDIASATAIRNGLKENKAIHSYVPKTTFDALNQQTLLYKENLEDLILYQLRTLDVEDIAKIHDVSEGLEYKIKKASSAATYEALIERIISKRFTRTRIQRILIKILLNIKKDDLNDLPRYARILAFNDKGKTLLRRIKKESDITLINNLNKTNLDKDIKKMIAFDIKATNVYNLLYSENEKSGDSDFLKAPIQV